MKKFKYLLLLIFMFFPVLVKADGVNIVASPSPNDTVIDSISYYIALPKIDNVIRSEEYSMGNYTISSRWYDSDNNPLDDSVTFKKNREYTLKIRMTPNDGYVFSNTINVELQNYMNSDFFTEIKEPIISNYSYETEIVYNTSYDLYTLYDDYYFQNRVSIGKRPESHDFYYQNVNIVESWYNVTDDRQMTVNDYFEKSKKYEYTIRVIPNAGFKLSKYINVNVYNLSAYYTGIKSLDAKEDEYKVIYEFDTTQQEGVFYGPVEVDLSKSEIGKKFQYIENGEEYTITQSWHELDDNYSEVKVIGENDTIEKGKKYRLDFSINEKEGYQLSDGLEIDYSKTIVNPMFYYANAISYGRYGSITMNTNNVYIENVYGLSTYSANPVIGEKYGLSSINSEYDESRYEISSQRWYNVSDNKLMAENDKFEKNKTYEYTLKLSPLSVYSFVDDIVNSQSVNNLFYTSYISGKEITLKDGVLEIKYTFDLTEKDGLIYGSLSINNVNPTIGQHVSLAYSNDDRYSIRQYWSRLNDDVYLTENDVFEENKIYRYYMELIPNEGYSFAEDFDIKCDEIVNNPYSVAGGGDMVQRSFTFIFSDQIDNPDVFMGGIYTDIVPPEIGSNPVYPTISGNFDLIEQWDNITDGKVLGLNDVFEEGKQYKFSVSLEPNDGKTILDGMVYMGYRDYKNSQYYVSDSEICKNNRYDFTATYDLSKTDDKIIDEIDIDGTNIPSVGSMVNFSDTDDGRIEMFEYWYVTGNEYRLLEPGELFEEGKSYYYNLTIKPKDGYKLAHNLKVNGLKIDGNYNIYDNELYLYSYFNNLSSIPQQGVKVSNKYLKNDTFTVPYGLEELDIKIDELNGEIYQIQTPNVLDYDIIDGHIKFNNFNILPAGSYDLYFCTNLNSIYHYDYYKLEIKKSPVILPEITNYDGTFDGENHTIEVKGGEGGILKYSLDNKNWSNILPSTSAVGQTKVYVKVEPDVNHLGQYPIYGMINIKEVVPKKDNDIKINSNDLTYNGESQTLVNTSKECDVYYSISNILNKDNYTSGTLEIPSGVNAGKYTIYYYVPEDDDYKEKSGKVTAEIKKAPVNSPTVNDYVGFYDGFAHTIEVNGENLEYSLDGINFADELPTFVEPGTYKVYVRVKPNDNYLSSDVIQGNVKIKSIETFDNTITYNTHIEQIGWDKKVRNGETSGTEGKSLRLEGIKINLSDTDFGDVEYSTHVQNIGWQGYVKNGSMAGTSGKALRLEAIKIRLTGEVAENYDVYYRVHAEKFGWLGWAKNDEEAGTSGYGYRLEAIQIKLIKKGEEFDTGGDAYKFQKISYHTHIQDIGWEDIVSDGMTAGTTGLSKRLEGIRIKLSDSISGGVKYSTHVQNIGWMDYVSDTQTAGTVGQSLRLEAIKIKLTGEAANNYDIYYRVHAEMFGWLGWAKNDEEAGSSGYGYRLEAIQIKLVNKGEEFDTGGDAYKSQKISYHTHIQDIGWEDIVSDGMTAGTTGLSKRLEGIRIKLSDSVSGGVSYSTHVQNIGWMDYVPDTYTSGTVGQSLRLEAIKIKLIGEAANNYDIYYRVHAEMFGWLGWAKNDEEAGTSGYGYRLEAIQIKLIKKGEEFDTGGDSYKTK